ncbi:stress-response A/B barrel domain-containing protein At5g22580 [Euphorbia lathyris]|uniref:stress-response A/B barrel domain-containing protein At5g22580 n=1 Tax=Euphorbia lathyris TaxID=212925 RepID=UPI003313DA81
MGEFKHLVIVKFKEGSQVEEILKGMEKLVADVDLVKSFEWGQDLEGPEMLTQGFTHSFSMTFDKKEDYIAFQTHPNHVEYSATFSAAILNIVVLTFPSVTLKPLPPPPPATTAA